MRRKLALWLGAYVMGCLPFTASAENGVGLTSIVAVIANPQNYANREIVVEGYLAFRLEDNAVYLGKDAFAHHLSTSAIWLEVSKEEMAELEKYERHYVRLSGVINPENKGHRGSYPAALTRPKFVAEMKGESLLCRMTRFPFFCYE